MSEPKTVSSVDLKSKWDDVFRKTKWARYPSEEMIRFVARHFSHVEDRRQIRFLDLGCGIGTSCWYLSREGYSADGVDGSDTAIETARQWFADEGLDATFKVSMMQNLPYDDQTFDAIIDCASVTSCPLSLIRKIVNEAYRVLKTGGLYYGAFFGAETTVMGVQNAASEDPAFYEEIHGGPLKNAATVRLLSVKELQNIFAGFANLSVDYSLRTANDQAEKVQFWHIVARK